MIVVCSSGCILCFVDESDEGDTPRKRKRAERAAAGDMEDDEEVSYCFNLELNMKLKVVVSFKNKMCFLLENSQKIFKFVRNGTRCIK